MDIDLSRILSDNTVGIPRAATHRTSTDLGSLQPVSCPFCSAQVILRQVSIPEILTAPRETHICDKYHTAVRDQVKKRFDFAMFLEQPSYICAVGFVLHVHRYEETWKGCLGCTQTRLNVTYKKSTARPFTLNAFLNDRVVHLVVSLPALGSLLESPIIASLAVVLA